MWPANNIHDLGVPQTNNNSVNGSGGARPKTRPGQAIGTEKTSENVGHFQCKHISVCVIINSP